MDDKTLTALKGSIEKWEKIVDGKEEDNGSENCPLCKKFSKVDINYNRYCKGCPVTINSHKYHCEKTPYTDWADYMEEEYVYLYDEWKVHDAKSKALAIAELEFLKGLLPVEESNVAIQKEETKGKGTPSKRPI